MNSQNRTIHYYNYFIPYHPFSRVASDIRYLPITNYERCKNADKGDIITLFGHDINGRISNVGVCTVRGKLIKYSEIASEEQKYCTDTFCWQLPVENIKARGSYFDIKLMLYCGFYMYDIPLRPRKITQTIWCETDIQYNIYHDYWYVWKYCDNQKIVEQYRRLVVHRYREIKMDETCQYRPFLNKHDNKCTICGITYNRTMIGSNHFFELHDTETDIMHPFRKLNQNKYIVLCPSCHKKLHFEMIPENITQSDHWYGKDYIEFYNETYDWSQRFCEEYNNRATDY